MKLPWSKEKYPYTRHSAPITNGILRNGKGSKSTNRPRRDDGMRVVSFALQRTGSSQMSQDMIRATTMREKSGASHGIMPSHRPKEEYRRRIRTNDREKSERNERSRHQQRGGKIKSVMQTRKERRRSDRTSSNVSRGSSGTDERRLSRSLTFVMPTRKERKRSDLTSSLVSRGSSGTDERRFSKSITSEVSDSKEWGRSDLTSSHVSRGSADTDGRRLSKSITSEVSDSKEWGRSDLASSHVSRGSADTDERRLSKSITSEVSDASSDTLGSLKRLGDMPAENIASGYGKWESNGTLDTADVSEGSAECPQVRTKHFSLSQGLLLLDKKIGAKKCVIDTADIVDDSKEQPRPRTKLSLLLDEKIKAKMRRQIQAYGKS